MNPDVKDYIEKQKSPQKEIINKIRKIILKTIPKCDEAKTWGVISYDKNKFYLVALKDKINLGFSIIGLDKEEIKLFEGSGKTMRHIKIRELKDIDEKKISKLLKLVHKKSKSVQD
jgi:hypothetical protein